MAGRYWGMGKPELSGACCTGGLPGSFTHTFSFGNFDFAASLAKAQLDLKLTGLKNGQFISFPSSANIVLGNVGTTPEPAAFSLMLSGIAGLGLLLRRRR